MNELQNVSDWMPFGIHLGIKRPSLESITMNYPNHAECHTQILKEWQKIATPTWSAVVHALAETGMRQLASDLAQKHGW